MDPNTQKQDISSQMSITDMLAMRQAMHQVSKNSPKDSTVSRAAKLHTAALTMVIMKMAKKLYATMGLTKLLGAINELERFGNIEKEMLDLVVRLPKDIKQLQIPLNAEEAEIVKNVKSAFNIIEASNEIELNDNALAKILTDDVRKNAESAIEQFNKYREGLDDASAKSLISHQAEIFSNQAIKSKQQDPLKPIRDIAVDIYKNHRFSFAKAIIEVQNITGWPSIETQEFVLRSVKLAKAGELPVEQVNGKPSFTNTFRNNIYALRRYYHKPLAESHDFIAAARTAISKNQDYDKEKFNETLDWINATELRLRNTVRSAITALSNDFNKLVEERRKNAEEQLKIFGVYRQDTQVLRNAGFFEMTKNKEAYPKLPNIEEILWTSN